MQRIAALLLFWVSANSFAYCSAPSFFGMEPSAPSSIQRPSEPFCLSGQRFTGTNTCSQYELDSYVSEINDYIRQLNTFNNSAREFAAQAVAYANEASRYAKCEAEEVKESLGR